MTSVSIAAGGGVTAMGVASYHTLYQPSSFQESIQSRIMVLVEGGGTEGWQHSYLSLPDREKVRRGDMVQWLANCLTPGCRLCVWPLYPLPQILDVHTPYSIPPAPHSHYSLRTHLIFKLHISSPQQVCMGPPALTALTSTQTLWPVAPVPLAIVFSCLTFLRVSTEHRWVAMDRR